MTHTSNLTILDKRFLVELAVFLIPGRSSQSALCRHSRLCLAQAPISGPLLFSCRLKSSNVKAMIGSSIENGAFFNPTAFPPIFVYFLANMIWGALATFFPLYAINHGVTDPGFFFAVYAVALILGRALGARILDSYRRDKVILPSLTAYTVGMTVLAFSTTLKMFILVAIIQATGRSFLMPTLVAHTINLAPIPFEARHVALAKELKRLGLPWTPHVGCFVWDAENTIEAGSPFPANLYFILSLPRFLGIFGSLDAMVEKLVWLPTWHQARLLRRRMGIKFQDIVVMWNSDCPLGPGDDLEALYEKPADVSHG